jgi:elongation factor G
VQADTGVLAGFPTVDFKYTLVDGKYHDVDSSALAFEIAAKACFREGMKKAGPVILEPIMKVAVEGPSELQGGMTGLLLQRRGIIMNTAEDDSGFSKVEAEVPLAEMFGFSTALRSATQGKAEFTMEFSKYAQVPNSIAEELIKKHKAEEEKKKK